MHARCVRTSVDESSIDEKISATIARLGCRNVGDWFRAMGRKREAHVSRRPGPRSGISRVGPGAPTLDQPLRSTRGFVSLSPPLSLTHTLSSPFRDEENLADIFGPNFLKSRRNKQVGRKRRAVVGLAGGPFNGRAVREPRRWDNGHNTMVWVMAYGPRS